MCMFSDVTMLSFSLHFNATVVCTCIICTSKKLVNLLIFDKMMAMSLWPHFFGIPCMAPTYTGTITIIIREQSLNSLQCSNVRTVYQCISLMLFQCKPKSHFLLFHAEICLCHFMKHGLWPVKYTRTQHPLSGTTWVGWYQNKHIHTHTDPDHQTSIINFLHPLWSVASSLFNLRAWQYSLTTSFQVLFDLPLGLWPSASYPIHFFTQSSSFCNTCPYHCRPFCCNTNVMSSIPNFTGCAVAPALC